MEPRFDISDPVEKKTGSEIIVMEQVITRIHSVFKMSDIKYVCPEMKFNLPYQLMM